MSAETFTTAMFLITAVIAAGVLINAVFPVSFTRWRDLLFGHACI